MNKLRKKSLSCLRKECHELMKNDSWYACVADNLGIKRSACHFSRMNRYQLIRSIMILERLNKEAVENGDLLKTSDRE